MREIPRLVLVTNRRTARLPLPELIRQALSGGADVVQLREKDLSTDEVRDLIASILDAGVAPKTLMVNGCPDLASEFGIGLHLPEAQRTTMSDRRPNVLLSQSIHSPEAATSAGAPDFLIAGHVFATASKPGLAPLGLQVISDIVAASRQPVLAIGGITPERVGAVQRAGAHGIAVLSGINDSPDPASAAFAFRNALESIDE